MKGFMDIKGIVSKNLEDNTEKSYICIRVPFDKKLCNPEFIHEMIFTVLKKHIKTKGNFDISKTPVVSVGYVYNYDTYVDLLKVYINVNKKRRYKLIEELRGKRFRNKFKRNLFARCIQDRVYYLDRFTFIDELVDTSSKNVEKIKEEF